jgi:CTP synthase
MGIGLATTTEIDPNTKYPIIDLMHTQDLTKDLGGTQRLGLYTCHIKPNTLAQKLYQKDVIEERHRHRYEFNNAYRDAFESYGMVFSGLHEKLNLVEMIEIPEHPFFIACQFHPEFLSRPLRPHPIFKGFIEAAILNKQDK